VIPDRLDEVEVLVQMGWKKYYLKGRSSSAIGSPRRHAQGKSCHPTIAAREQSDGPILGYRFETWKRDVRGAINQALLNGRWNRPNAKKHAPPDVILE
jgi:hypothetical protein